MTYILSAALTAAFATGGFAQQGQPITELPVKNAMQPVYDALQKDYNKGDFDAITSYFAPSFHWRQLDGKSLDLAQAKKDIKEEMSNIENGKWKIDVVNLIVSKTVASAVVQYSFKGAMLDDSRKPYHTELTTTERQNWSWSHDGWKLINSAILGSESKQNGINLNPNVKTPDKPVQTPKSDGSNGGMP